MGHSRTQKNFLPQALQYDIYRLSVKEWLKYGSFGLLLNGMISYVFYRSTVAFIILSPLSVLYPLYQREKLRQRRLETLRSQFKEAALILASSLSAGYSVENAFSVTGVELEQLYGPDGMITTEVDGIVSQLRVNRTVEELLMDFAERSGLDDIKNFAEVFSVAKRSGGELVQIINHVTKVISDKIQVGEEIITMTTEKRFEQNIMNLAPFLIVIYIDMTSPGFFDVMYTTLSGRLVMSVCLFLYGISVLMSQKILNIEV